MTWPFKLPLGLIVLALLTGCVSPPPPPPAAPRILPPPVLSAADISKAESHAYWSGFAAGRRYQKQQNAAARRARPAAPPATPPVPPAAPLPLQPVPPPADGYTPKGPAQPVAEP